MQSVLYQAVRMHMQVCAAHTGCASAGQSVLLVAVIEHSSIAALMCAHCCCNTVSDNTALMYACDATAAVLPADHSWKHAETMATAGESPFDDENNSYTQQINTRCCSH
jgi:hypothetical protein